jgi:hypothetical protein
MNDELQRMWMESVMVKFEELFLYLLGGAEDKYEELQ